MASWPRLSLILPLAALVACQSKLPPPANSPPAVDIARISPMGAARQLAVQHKSRAYDAMARGIVPDQRDSFVGFIRAVDEVLAANESLRLLTEERYSAPAVEALSLSPMADNLGLFSRSVTFFSEDYLGSKAYVTLQEGEQVPLVHAEFEYCDGRWLFRPRTVPAACAAEMSRLASILIELRRGVEAGQTVDRFAAAFETRVPPQIRRISEVREVKLAGSALDP